MVDVNLSSSVLAVLIAILYLFQLDLCLNVLHPPKKENVNIWNKIITSSSMCVCSYLEFLKGLEDQIEKDWPQISSSLEEIRTSLLSKNGCLINLTADGKNLTNAEKHISNFLDLLPSTSLVEPAAWNAQLSRSNEAIVVPTQVSCLLKFCSLTCQSDRCTVKFQLMTLRIPSYR